MAYTTLWSYTCDLINESVDDNINHLRNEIGLDAISVATAYHTYEMLCAHQKGKKFRVVPESAVYFHPQLDLYADTPIKPYVSPVAQPHDPLRQVSDACSKYGMKMTSWTVCLHNSKLPAVYPEHAQVNAFGDIYTHALCPSSPAVRSYMKALLLDLTTNYPITAVELESLNFQGYSQGHYHAKYGLEPGPIESLLFSLCFCDHCTTRAHDHNVDVGRLKKSVCSQLNQYCEDSISNPAGLAEYVDADQDLQRFIKMRVATVSSLTREIKSALSVPLYYLLMGNYYGSGMDYYEVANIVDRVEILAYTASPDQVKTSINNILEYKIRPDQMNVGMQAYAPASPDEATLVRTTQAALDEGIRGFSFYNYGIMPKNNIQWLKAVVALIEDSP